MHADPLRLRQVRGNLLSNAIKYERRGAEVGIAISDSGVGLDAAQVERLFMPFERLGAEHGPVSGTGLGLALSRQLTQATGGRIEVHSSPGQGRCFTVWLPAARGGDRGGRAPPGVHAPTPFRRRPVVLPTTVFRPLPSAVFYAHQHLWSRVFAPMAALQILAMPPGIAAVRALPRGRIRRPISAAQRRTLH